MQDRVRIRVRSARGLIAVAELMFLFADPDVFAQSDEAAPRQASMPARGIEIRRGDMELPIGGAGNSSVADPFTTLLMAGAQRPQMTFDRAEFQHGLGRHTHQQAIHQLLMAAEHVSQF